MLLLPFLSNLKGIPFAELPSYLRSGAACFLNVGANTTGKFSSFGIWNSNEYGMLAEQHTFWSKIIWIGMLTFLRLWRCSSSTPTLHCCEYGFQHLSALSCKDFFCCGFISCSNIIRYKPVCYFRPNSISYLFIAGIICMHLFVPTWVLIWVWLLFFSVPISIFVLTLSLPYLPQEGGLSPFFVIGSAVLVLGLALYNLPQPANEGSKIDWCCSINPSNKRLHTLVKQLSKLPHVDTIASKIAILQLIWTPSVFEFRYFCNHIVILHSCQLYIDYTSWLCSYKTAVISGTHQNPSGYLVNPCHWFG